MAAAASLRLAALVLLAVLGGASHAVAATVQCSTFTPYTLKIFNNTKLYNIWPVIATPTNGADEWLQGAAQIQDGQNGTILYGHKNVYRMYFKPLAGIPPNGGFITITLPLCSQLIKNENGIYGTVPDEYINWWNGGRLYLYDNLVSKGGPPQQLVNDFTIDNKPANTVTPLALEPVPYCAECPDHNPTIFRSPVALPANDPAQLTEYTLADVDKGDKTNNFTWSLKVGNVDYDISYVDHVYLPVAMGSIKNPDNIGYIGSIQDVDQFRQVMGTFLKDFTGWPRYLNPILDPITHKHEPYLRIPGPYNAYKQYDSIEKTIIEEPGQAITRLGILWNYCVTTMTDQSQMCLSARTVNTFFLNNYTKYKTMVDKGECNPPVTPPPTPTLVDVLAHVYGWVPWNEHCTEGAKANDLDDKTDNFRAVHKTYITLQYTSLSAQFPYQTFNPYVNLVHGAKYLNMPGSYAFSIDDDVGNIHVPAAGVIITVGGSGGLENDVPFDPTKIISVNLGDPKNLKRPLWGQSSFCLEQTPPFTKDINNTTLFFQITSVRFPCTVALTD
jgi:hypothetical protein